MPPKNMSVICKLSIRDSADEPSAYNSASLYDSYPNSIGSARQDHHAEHPEESTATGVAMIAPLPSDPPPRTKGNCQWCLHEFNTHPVGMPVSKQSSGKIAVEGMYCSLECACAHNFDKLHASHEAFARHYLCCELASTASTTGPVHINPAPARELLDTFGGPLSIEQFRDREGVYSVVYPMPVIAHAKQSEDLTFGTMESLSRTKRFVPIDEDKIDSFTSGLRRPEVSKRGFKSTLDYMCALSGTSACAQATSGEQACRGR